jgi:sugar diacid utilization regulator
MRTWASCGAPGVHSVDLGYQLDAEHLGVIARGAGAPRELRRIAQSLDRRLLVVPAGEGTVWAWLGGRRALELPMLERALSQSQAGAEVSLALGEPAAGFEGWRLTHRQAQEALLVALRRPQRCTRYSDVALLAAALRDDTLSRSLIGIYLSPLDNTRDGGPVLRETLRAYLVAERNVSSAAIALGIARSTVESRLRIIEARLGRTPHSCPAGLEVALQLDQLGTPAATGAATVGRARA